MNQMQSDVMLYAHVMDWTLRELRYFLAVLDAGSFTDGAADAGVSQAAMSRTITSTERRLGERLLRRTPHGCEPTPLGRQLADQARRVLAEVERLDALAHGRHRPLRVGYAWAAVGRHTAPLMRDWPGRHPEIDLHLVRHNTPTGGLAEGHCDAAIMRTTPDQRRLEAVVIGLEGRLVAYASDDTRWARRRQITMAEIAERTVVIDPRTGTTTSRLWDGTTTPGRFVHASDIDEWLDAIAAGQGVGVTADATASHHTRPGVTFRPVSDGPRIPVHLAWWRDAPPHGLTELVDELTGLYRRAPAAPARRRS